MKKNLCFSGGSYRLVLLPISTQGLVITLPNPIEQFDLYEIPVPNMSFNQSMGISLIRSD